MGAAAFLEQKTLHETTQAEDIMDLAFLGGKHNLMIAAHESLWPHFHE